MFRFSKKNIFILILIIVAISTIFYNKTYFSSIDPTVLTLVSGAIGFIISKIFEDLKESRQRIYEQKRKYYNDLIRPFRDLIKPSNTNKKAELSIKQINDAMDSAFDNILYASDDVIEKYGNFRNINSNPEHNSTNSILKLFAELLLAMRKDLGNNYTSLDEVQILRMFINMSREDERMYRKEFKKIK